MNRPPVRPAVLCIGGLDPSGGAGLLADAESVRAAGGRALTAATAITVQSRRGVARVATLPAGLVVAQVERLFDDEAPRAVKLGMLGNREVARALAKCLAGRLGRYPLVVDPVLRSSSGSRLFRGAPRDYRRLLSLGGVLTPNLPEAASLLGRSLDESRRSREAAARELTTWGPRAVILKGGHARRSADDLVLRRADAPLWLTGQRISGSRRGTGCRFASFLAARLAAGDALPQAARAAKRHVRGYLLEA